MTTKHQRTPIVAGNWKLNGSLALVKEFTAAFDQFNASNVTTLVCPPAVYISAFSGSNLAVGAQDVSAFVSGAHTGEMSAQMYSEVGCEFIIVGHSERRQDHHESDEMVVAKAKQVIACGMTPIICVGEPLNEREAGTFEAFIGAQVDAITAGLSVEELGKSVIAYEPIWAIGTGKTASPEQAQAVHAVIRSKLSVVNQEVAAGMRILYGGSVKASNAQAIFSQADVDGGLVGGASLDPQEFTAICQAAN